METITGILFVILCFLAGAIGHEFDIYRALEKRGTSKGVTFFFHFKVREFGNPEKVVEVDK